MKAKRVDLDRIRVPTRVIVHRSELAAAALAELVQKGELAPGGGGGTCELEAGGVVVARGKIVKRRGEYCFKVLETAEEARP